MFISTIVSELRGIVNRHDDDSVDRYNHRYTVMILAIFIFIISSKQYFGEPIVCWTPAQFTGSHNAYANAICWTHGTYPIANDQPYHTVNRANVLPYYQWVPFILLFQAFCFWLPNYLWNSLSKQTGIDIGGLVKNAIQADNMDIDKREKTIEQIARHLHISLSLKYDYIPMLKAFNFRKRIPLGKRHGNYLYLIYIFVKFFYIINVLGQLFLMNLFFGFQYHSYGIEFLTKFIRGDDYSRIDLAFPRVTFCDFKIRNLGDNIHQHSVQCALPINLFNEKFFICLWFWLIALAVLTVWNFMRWLLIFPQRYRKISISKYLKTQKQLSDNEKDDMLLDAFVNEYCHLDGSFIFSLIRRNTNFITTSEIICALWMKFCRDYTKPTEMKPLFGEHRKRNDYDVDDNENLKYDKNAITSSMTNV